MSANVNEEVKIAKTNHDQVVAGRRLLSAEELGSWLQVPVSTLYVWKYKGIGPPVHRVGRHLRYREDQVVVWLEEQRSGRQEDPR